jgi:hypothetical protein
MTTWSARFCPAARSRRRPISTPSSPAGWRSSTPARGGHWAAHPPIASERTGPRCWRCRRWRQRRVGVRRCGCPGITTCVWIPTTTRCTRPASGAGCWCAPIFNGVQAFSDGQLVADHERIWAVHQTISYPNHVQAAKVLRRKHISTARPIPSPTWRSDASARRPKAHARPIRHSYPEQSPEAS